MRLFLAIAVSSLLACSDDPTPVQAGATPSTGAGVGAATSASSSTGLGGDGGLGAGGEAGAGGSGAGGSATAVASSSSSASSGAGGAGGAPGECAAAADGTQCTETCGCPPCAPAQQANCAWGLCQSGACVDYIPVKCKMNGGLMETYQGCGGIGVSNLFISWETGWCNGSPNAPSYCAPGTPCTVTKDGDYKGEGVCL